MLACLSVLCHTSATLAKIKLPASLADNNMVLQRGCEAPAWGCAEPGEMVAVTVDEQSVTAKADKCDRWQVEPAKIEPGGPFGMIVNGLSGSKVALKNLLAGEVWLCSGLSNIAWELHKSKHAEAEIAAAKYPQIRLFQLKHIQPGQAADRLPGSIAGMPTRIGGRDFRNRLFLRSTPE